MTTNELRIGLFVQPSARTQPARDVPSTLVRHVALEQPAREVLGLDERLARDVGEDQRPVLVLARLCR